MSNIFGKKEDSGETSSTTTTENDLGGADGAANGAGGDDAGGGAESIEEPDPEPEPELETRGDPNARPTMAEALANSTTRSTPEVNDGGGPVEGMVLFTSHPIHKLDIGNDYIFVDGQLSLPADQVAAFEELLAKQPHMIRNVVKKLDMGVANRLIMGSIGSRMRQGMDSTANTLPLPKGEGV